MLAVLPVAASAGPGPGVYAVKVGTSWVKVDPDALSAKTADALVGDSGTIRLKLENDIVSVHADALTPRLMDALADGAGLHVRRE